MCVSLRYLIYASHAPTNAQCNCKAFTAISCRPESNFSRVSEAVYVEQQMAAFDIAVSCNSLYRIHCIWKVLFNSCDVWTVLCEITQTRSPLPIWNNTFMSYRSERRVLGVRCCGFSVISDSGSCPQPGPGCPQYRQLLLLGVSHHWACRTKKQKNKSVKRQPWSY